MKLTRLISSLLENPAINFLWLQLHIRSIEISYRNIIDNQI